MHPLWLAIRLPQLPLEVLPPSATEATPSNPRAEREAVKALCAAAYQFSSTVTAQARAPQPDVHTIWLEVGASLRLFGGLDPLIAKLAAVLSRIGYSHQFGVAPTLEGASLLAGDCWSDCRSGPSIRPLRGLLRTGFSRDGRRPLQPFSGVPHLAVSLG